MRSDLLLLPCPIHKSGDRCLLYYRFLPSFDHANQTCMLLNVSQFTQLLQRYLHLLSSPSG
ncbi:hypothetical protein DFQ01_103249 [Paenibacillus cellulosilyticus]|uniref:Uncharacterized protein n=1 Tax=Paenibacillus cellulosilyticus TaxID=375489 RepID=A0A2V2YX65_9BACL|nr:hypothetical protein DFQ01_103249 [Paenibacillus cellulosilyticus]